MVAPLFRKEVFEARMDDSLGSLSLGKRLDFLTFAGICACVLVALLSFLFFGELSRRATVRGFLVPSVGSIHDDLTTTLSINRFVYRWASSLI